MNINLKKIFIVGALFFCIIAPKTIFCGEPEFVTQKEFNTLIRDFKSANFITLKDYLDSRLEANNEAIKIARESMEKRLDGMNEFRASLKDQSAMFISNVEFDANMVKIEDKINQLRESIKNLQLDFKDQSALLISNNEYDATIKTIKEDIKSLQMTRAELEGKASQTAAIFGIAVGLLGVIMGGISLIITINKKRKKEV